MFILQDFDYLEYIQDGQLVCVFSFLDMLNHYGICSSCGGPFLRYYSCSIHFSLIGVFYRLPLYEHSCSPHSAIPCSMKKGVG